MRVRIFCLAFTLCLGLNCLFAQTHHWIAEGNRALYAGRPTEAAANYQAALDAISGSNIPPEKLVHLHVTLATAYLEAGNLRAAEGVLTLADKTRARLDGDQSRAEVLNGWSVLHMLQGKLAKTETELRQARGIMQQAPHSGDLLASVLHNLAAVEMRTGEYEAALCNEQEALLLWGKRLNSDHPHIIRGWAGLGSLQYLLNRPKEAQQSLERAIASARATYDSSSPLVAELLDSDALILDRLKLKHEAKLARAEARQIRGGKPAAEYVRATWNVKEALAPDSAVYLRSR